jgi:hypothetical protein
MQTHNPTLNFPPNTYFETGSHEKQQTNKIITYPLGKYEFKILLTNDDKFIDIIEININKNFISNQAKATPKGYHDVDKYYAE